MEEVEQAATAAEVALMLRIAKDSVYRMAAAGEIPSFKVGRSWRFFPSKVVAHLSTPRDRWSQSNRSRGRKRAS